MGLHRLSSITIGVPNVEETAQYYDDFGLIRDGGTFSTTDGGEQLRLVSTPTRRALEIVIGADDADDLSRIASRLAKLEIDAELDDNGIIAVEPFTRVRFVVRITDRIKQPEVPRPAQNGPGRTERTQARAEALDREGPVRPRKLGHVVLGSLDAEASQRFLVEGIGLKISDVISGHAAFLRCSTDHHNVLVQQSPVAFLHHTSWQVDDVDEVGRGAINMIEGHPERHTWGLGRHYIGSNFFWYLRDPAGNFSEYYSDMDCILDDQLWEPGVFEPGPKAGYLWGPQVPASMIRPDDLAELMTGAHQPG
ncbi:VOC family protein [Planotetraspora sp. GP83]|uniref:VOC family protein n=1 Tax=Planotetraspora sp. GP83 TaxID=3156264 RepID=UPI0035115E93